MASTNKTTNYQLSQFLGSDKPAWLGDYNTDMSKIDTALKNNADGVTSATGEARAAQATADTAVTTASTAQTAAETAQSTANSAGSQATTNAAAISALQDDVAELQGINAYSTTAKVVGEWVDGVNRIYRKVYTGTTASGSMTTFTIPDALILLDAKATVLSQYNNNWLVPSGSPAEYASGFNWDSGNHELQMHLPSILRGKAYTLVVEYVAP